MRILSQIHAILLLIFISCGNALAIDCDLTRFARIGEAREIADDIRRLVAEIRARDYQDQHLRTLLELEIKRRKPAVAHLPDYQHLIILGIEKQLNRNLSNDEIMELWQIGNVVVLDALTKIKGKSLLDKDFAKWREAIRSKLQRLFRNHLRHRDGDPGISETEWDAIYHGAGLEEALGANLKMLDELVEIFLRGQDRRAQAIFELKVLGRDPTTKRPLLRELTDAEIAARYAISPDTLQEILGRLNRDFTETAEGIRNRTLAVTASSEIEPPKDIFEFADRTPKVVDTPRVDFGKLDLAARKAELIRQYQLLMELNIARDPASISFVDGRFWSLVGINADIHLLPQRVTTVFKEDARKAGMTVFEYLKHLTNDINDQVRIRVIPMLPTRVQSGRLSDEQLKLISLDNRGYNYLTPEEILRDLQRQIKAVEVFGFPITAKSLQQLKGRTPTPRLQPLTDEVNLRLLPGRIQRYLNCPQANLSCLQNFIDSHYR